MPNVKFITPSPYSQQAAELDRRQKMAELLQQQVMEPMQQQAAGGKVIPISPLTGLTRILQSYTAQKQLKDLGYERAKLEQSDIDAARKMAEEFGRPTVELPIAQNDTTLRELNVRRVPSSTPGGLDQTQLVSPASESEIKSYLLPKALGAGVGPYQQKLAELLYTQKPEREEFGTTPVKGADGNYYLVGKSGTIRRTDISAPDTSEQPKTVGGMMWNSETKRFEKIPDFVPASGSDSGPRASQGPIFALPDGRVTASVFENGKFYYETSTGRQPVPPDARPTTPGVAAPLSQSQFIKYRQDINKDKQSLGLLNNYFATVKDMNVGYKRLADQISANAKNFFGNELNVKELATQLAKGEKELLVGLFRTEVAGPGVVTADDYQRIMSALGGDPAKLQNPQVTESLLRNLYDTKKANVEFLERELSRSNQYYGVPASPPVPEFGGTQPSESSTPSRGFGKAVRE